MEVRDPSSFDQRWDTEGLKRKLETRFSFPSAMASARGGVEEKARDSGQRVERTKETRE